MKQQNRYELVGDIWYCNIYGIYAQVTDLSEPGFEPWVRFQGKTKISGCDFVYHGERGILRRLEPKSINEAFPKERISTKLKINRKKYRLLLKQVHEKTPQLRKNKYLLGWPGNYAISTGI